MARLLTGSHNRRTPKPPARAFLHWDGKLYCNDRYKDCHKTHDEARAALARTARHQRPEDADRGKLGIYKHECGYFHIGHSTPEAAKAAKAKRQSPPRNAMSQNLKAELKAELQRRQEAAKAAAIVKREKRERRLDAQRKLGL